MLIDLYVFLIVSFLFLLSFFGGFIKMFIISPLTCFVKGHVYESFVDLSEGYSLMQCKRCHKCIDWKQVDKAKDI